MTKVNLDLALIGNCQIASLIDRNATHIWTCWPRLDGDPIFSDLLAGSKDPERPGRWAIELSDQVSSRQSYERNTAIVETVLTDSKGASVAITDFCPRYPQFERSYRPTTLVRIVRPLSGRPRLRIRLNPTEDYGETVRQSVLGSHHIRYVGNGMTLRLTTNAGLAGIQEQRIFVLDDTLAFILGPDEIVHESVLFLAERLLASTRDYWHDWVRSLAVPFDWQEAVIRAAITLKLCSYEDTGAIIAAITTSIPESPDSGRNWDYRYCWIRDTYFTVQALNRLGATRTMEGYLRFIQNLTATPPHRLQPCYGIDGELKLVERVAPHLKGYRGMGPVRVGNAAYSQLQTDIYGAAILSVTQSFFDDRLMRPGTRELFHMLEPLGQQAIRLFGKPDASIWEYRGHSAVHTFSSAACWAAADRLSRIAGRLALRRRENYWRSHADKMRAHILKRGWSRSLNSFTSTFGGDSVDASLLLLAELGTVDWQDPKYIATVNRIGKTLKKDGMLARYVEPDDFGVPKVAFSVCTFWYINALCAIGRRDEAIEMFEEMLRHRNHVGLMSEDLSSAGRGELWGNFPQTYSMVGIVNCAMRLSRPWDGAL